MLQLRLPLAGVALKVPSGQSWQLALLWARRKGECPGGGSQRGAHTPRVAEEAGRALGAAAGALAGGGSERRHRRCQARACVHGQAGGYVERKGVK